MPPSKWDEEEEETSSGSEASTAPVVTSTRRKFDDEEDSDEVVDSWDAEDSEEERKKAATAAAIKAKAEAEAAANKKSKAQRIEEHREAARRRRAAEEVEDGSDDEDEAARRARLRQTEQDADLQHASDLFGSVGLGPKTRKTTKAVIVEDTAKPGQSIDLSQYPLFKPATKTQFEALSAALIPLLTASSSQPHYGIWVQDFVKKITAPLPSSDIKKAASGLTALSNEKMKEEKAQDKGGKKTKAAKKATLSAGRDISRGAADTTAYDDDGLGDDDFM